MNEARNTVTLLTPPGVGAIAVVRIRGPAAEASLANHFKKPVPRGRCVHGNLEVGGQVVDDIIAVRVGDTAFDLNVHGGDWIVRSVIDLFAKQGFAVTSESSDQADTRLQMEVLIHLQHATTEAGVRMLLAQESLWKALKKRSEQGESISAVLTEALQNRTLDRLLQPPRVAIVGPANVGKSTLANQLFDTARSITADVPGTTRDWVGELANINDLPVMLIDTPGIRQTSDAIEHAAIGASGREIEQSELVVVVIDATRPLEQQRAVLEKFPDATIVVNKSDRPIAVGIDSVDGIRTVATTGTGIDQLRRKIVEFFCGHETIDLTKPSVWTQRQRNIVERAVNDISALCDL